ncbi:MAG: fumarylacetoacetase, partial [Pyrinomonadaceae bacterium]
MIEINETHDQNLKSWIESANAPDTDFPIQNLPFCGFQQKRVHSTERIGVIIGDQVLNLSTFSQENLLDEQFSGVFTPQIRYLNLLATLPTNFQTYFRKRLVELFREDSTEKETISKHLIPVEQVEFQNPWLIGDYTDFYCSIYHAMNVGKLFRPDNPLMPNYKWIPIGYHGRASSIVVSGEEVIRPKGQNHSNEN